MSEFVGTIGGREGGVAVMASESEVVGPGQSKSAVGE